MPGRCTASRPQNAIDLPLTRDAHQGQRAPLEAERQPTTQIEVRSRADVAIEDIDRLRDQDAEQTIRIAAWIMSDTATL